MENNNNSEEVKQNSEEKELTGLEKRLANLQPFKPNNPETGEKDERINRKGSKGNRSISAQWEKGLAKTVGQMIDLFGVKSKVSKQLRQFPRDMTIEELLAYRTQLYAALNSNNVSVKMLSIMLDRTEGKVTENVDITTNGKSIVLSDAERLERLAAIFNTARARRSGQSSDDGTENVPASSEETSTTL